MKDRLLIEPAWRGLLARCGLHTARALIEHFTAGAVLKPGVWVQPCLLPSLAGGADIFYKQYEFSPPSWSFLGRASKALREWESYDAFAAAGVNCAQRIAAGEERDAIGRLKRAFLITLAVPGARTLTEFVAQDCPDPSKSDSRRLRHQLIMELAEMTRRIHDRGFFHNDLYWRNVLATRAGNGTPRLWWIDSPRGRHARLHQAHRRVKDLACLDRMASEVCSRRERLAFVRAYLGEHAAAAEVKKLALAVDSYRRRRWSPRCFI